MEPFDCSFSSVSKNEEIYKYGRMNTQSTHDNLRLHFLSPNKPNNKLSLTRSYSIRVKPILKQSISNKNQNDKFHRDESSQKIYSKLKNIYNPSILDIIKKYEYPLLAKKKQEQNVLRHTTKVNWMKYKYNQNQKQQIDDFAVKKRIALREIANLDRKLKQKMQTLFS